MGFGDVRLMIVAAIALPWWTTLYTFTMSLLVAVALQLVTFIVASLLHRGREMDYTRGKIVRPLAKIFGKDIPLRTVKRRVTPFGPALMFSYLAVAFYSLYTYHGSYPASVIMNL